MLHHRFIALGLAMAGVWLVNVSTTHAGQDWPQWRGPNVDGVSPEKDWSPEKARVSWKVNVGVGYSPASVVGDRLYTMGHKGGKDIVYCLSATNGDEHWTYDYASPVFANMHKGGPSAAPAVSDGMVYTMSRGGYMLCLDAMTGQKKWDHQLPSMFGVKAPRWAFSGSVIVDGDQVIVDMGVIAAFNKKTGALNWKSRNYGEAYSTPMPFEHNGRKLVATFPRVGLVVLDATNGRELMKQPLTAKYEVNAATPIVTEAGIVISAGYGDGKAILVDFGGRQKWVTRDLRNKMASSVLHGSYLYGFDESRLRCISLDNGDSIWDQRGMGFGSLTIAGDTLVILSEGGDLVFAKATPRGFRPIKEIELFSREGKCWTMPVLAHGRVYARSPEGTLACVDVSN